MPIFGPKVALLIIDMIDDFISSDGVMYVPGVEDIVPAIKQIADEARDSKSPVIYICDSHRPSDMEPGTWLHYAENGAPEVQIVPQLVPAPGDFVVTKGRHTSFFSTDLNTLLEELGIAKLVLTGAAMDIWMYLIAEEAHKRGYQVVVPKRCVMALSENDKEEVLEQIRRLFKAEVI